MSSRRKRAPWAEICVNPLGCFSKNPGYDGLKEDLGTQDPSLKKKPCPKRKVKNMKEENGPQSLRNARLK